jgi:hypothetical protein
MQRFYVHVLSSPLTITSTTLILTQQAVAQDRPCLADAQRLCTDLTPGKRGNMMQCLKGQDKELLAACKARMQTMAQEPCAQDAMTLCKAVEPGNRRAMLGCLRDHDSDLSDGCKERLKRPWTHLR